VQLNWSPLGSRYSTPRIKKDKAPTLLGGAKVGAIRVYVYEGQSP
jgi:hypothetical protein